MFRRISSLSLLLLCLTGGVAVAAPGFDSFQENPQHPNMILAGPGGEHGPRGEGWLERLNLTPDQKQRIQSIRQRYKDPLKQRRAALRQARQELRSLMAGNASQNQIQDKFRQVQSLQQQLAEVQFNSMSEIREILTPEQRQRLAQIMQDRPQGGNRAGRGNRGNGNR